MERKSSFNAWVHTDGAGAPAPTPKLAPGGSLAPPLRVRSAGSSKSALLRRADSLPAKGFLATNAAAADGGAGSVDSACGGGAVAAAAAAAPRGRAPTMVRGRAPTSARGRVPSSAGQLMVLAVGAVAGEGADVLRVSLSQGGHGWTVHKRYADFVLLHEQLQEVGVAKECGVAFPPEANGGSGSGVSLDGWLRALLQASIATRDVEVAGKLAVLLQAFCARAGSGRQQRPSLSVETKGVESSAGDEGEKCPASARLKQARLEVDPSNVFRGFEYANPRAAQMLGRQSSDGASGRVQAEPASPTHHPGAV